MTNSIQKFINQLSSLGVTNITLDSMKPSKNCKIEENEVENLLNDDDDSYLCPSDKLSNLNIYRELFSKEGDRILARNVKDIYAIITYPLSTRASIHFHLENDGVDVTYPLLLYLHTCAYQLVYQLEDDDVGKPTGNIKGMFNREKSDGRFGIWGHHIDDLVYSGNSKVEIYSGSVVCQFNCDS